MDLSGLKQPVDWSSPRPKILVAVAGVVAVVAVLYFWQPWADDPDDALTAKDERKRLQAVADLSAKGTDKAMRKVARAASDPSPRVAARAVLAVSSSRLQERVDIVHRALRDSRPQVREAAVAGLGRIADKKDLPELKRIAVNPAENSRIRAAAVQALGKMGKEKAWEQREALIRALSDKDPLVRGRAHAALRAWTGRDFGFRATAPEWKRQQAIQTVHEMLD